MIGVLSKLVRGGRRLWREEDGPTAVEYAVMLAMICAVCVGSVNSLASALGDNLERTATAILEASGE